jgi:hypothetical protein
MTFEEIQQIETTTEFSQLNQALKSEGVDYVGSLKWESIYNKTELHEDMTVTWIYYPYDSNEIYCRFMNVEHFITSAEGKNQEHVLFLEAHREELKIFYKNNKESE